MIDAATQAAIEKAISDVVSNRDDLGNLHFMLIRDAVLEALGDVQAPSDSRADFVRRCQAYLEDAPGSGGHSDAAGSNAYELIAEAIEHCSTDTSDIPEADEAWFANAKLKLPPDISGPARFLLDRLDEYDPGEVDAERDFHGHVAPAMARLRDVLDDALPSRPIPDKKDNT